MNDLKREMELLLKEVKQLHTKIDVVLKGGAR